VCRPTIPFVSLHTSLPYRLKTKQLKFANPLRSDYAEAQCSVGRHGVLSNPCWKSNPVASLHKWRIGHESVAIQPSFPQLVRQKNCQISHETFSFFFQLNQFVSLFASNGSCNWVVKIYIIWKQLVQTAHFNIFFKFSVEQPNFLVFTWCGEFHFPFATPVAMFKNKLASSVERGTELLVVSSSTDSVALLTSGISCLLLRSAASRPRPHPLLWSCVLMKEVDLRVELTAPLHCSTFNRHNDSEQVT
jgi:hypothetical protein